MSGVRPRSREDLGWQLETRSTEHPDRVAVIDVEQQVRRTYRELEERACRTANALWSLGVRPGHNFGLLMQNSADFLEVVFAAAKIGATAVLVNRRLSPGEMAYELDDSESVGLVYSPQFDDAVAELRPLAGKAKWWSRTGGSGDRPDDVVALESLVADGAPSFEPPGDVVLAESGLVIIYTSGTTGKPKGVLLTQANIMAANDFTKRFLWARYGSALSPVVHALVTAGMNHIGGLNTSSLPVLADGGTLVVLDEFNPRRMLESIEKYRVNLAFSIGTMWNAVVKENLADFDLSSLEVVGTCIARHNEQQLRALHQGLGAEVYYMFGQTETTTGLITTHRTVDLWQRRGTLGKPAFMDIRVVTAEGKPAQVDEVGELQYRGPTVFREYYGKPEETAQAFDDGWFRSGDLVKHDADGYLYFVDRLKDMIKSGGLNVFTIEVERVLLDHPAVSDAAVVGVPDEKWGEAVTAFVVAEEDTDPAPQEIIDFCRERIAHYKAPKRIVFVDSIPVNSLGKKLKRDLLKNFRP
ncbi:AMP-binding protein [Amycolatopsis sp. NPDC005232]|uniref:class I adenylate-forming enzyme family protein n=1 Tax=Amycolatopsis sp. NPDC005232 TaxID=3157027 RepID=UPI0033ABECA9